MITDEQLLQAYVRGDVGAFEQLYERHAARLARYLRRSLTHSNQADEVFQETWLQVVRYAHRYQPNAQFQTWLFHIARSKAADLYRRRWVVVDPMVAPDSLMAADGADGGAVSAQLQARIRGALQQIPPEQRDVFLLREEADLPLPQIAEVLGEPYEAVKSRYRYAVARLRELLKDLR